MPGPWEALEPDLGWTDSSLRYRLIWDGRSVEIDGSVSGQVAGKAQAQIGTLAPGYRPVAPKSFVAAVNDVGLSAGFGFLEIQISGAVLIRPQAAMNFVTIGVLYPLDSGPSIDGRRGSADSRSS